MIKTRNIIVSKYISTIPRPRIILHQNKTRNVQITTRVNLLNSVNDFATSMHYVAKGVIIFTMFYSTMNWYYYKKMREDIEEENKKNNKK
jgi:hypothetical protein